MGFDINKYTEGTASPVEPKTSRAAASSAIVEKLRSTLKPTDAPEGWQQPSINYDATGADARQIAKAQGRLNAIGRRKGVEFSVQTQRVEKDGKTVIEAFAVPKRPSRPRKK